MQLQIRRLNEHSIIPTRAHATDAGLDLYANATVTMLFSSRKYYKTMIKAPENGKIEPHEKAPTSAVTPWERDRLLRSRYERSYQKNMLN